MGPQASLTPLAGSMRGRRAVFFADRKTSRSVQQAVVLLRDVLLAGMVMATSGNGSGRGGGGVGCKGWSARSSCFVPSLRPAYTPFLAAADKKSLGFLAGAGDGIISTWEERTDQAVSVEMGMEVEMVASAGRKGSQAARAYYERKREALSAWSEERRGRDLCERCRRARKMCLCSSLPVRAMPTSTRFVILQHPAETKKRITGTVPLVLHCLSNCRRIVMRSDYGEGELRRVLGVDVGGGEAGGAGERPPEDSSDRSSGGGEGGAASGRPFLLFPCPGAEYLEDIAAAARESSVSSAPPPPPEQTTSPPPPPPTAPTAPPPSSPSGPVVVLIDGTWSQAKQILSRYPFLSPRKPSVAGPDGRGLKLSSFGGAPSVGGPQHPGKRDNRSQGPEKENEAGVGGYAAEDMGGGAQKKDGALCRAVKFRSAGVSSYGFRREPTKECLSTLESVAYTLEVLEGTPEGAAAAAYLRKSFSAMVAMQLEAAEEAGGRPRFVDRKGRTANRNSTPPRKGEEKDGRRSGT